jgi:hypothetical protein
LVDPRWLTAPETLRRRLCPLPGVSTAGGPHAAAWARFSEAGGRLGGLVSTVKRKNWLPLESSPEILDGYLAKVPPAASSAAEHRAGGVDQSRAEQG